jgi:hypothetical protein
MKFVAATTLALASSAAAFAPASSVSVSDFSNQNSRSTGQTLCCFLFRVNVTIDNSFPLDRI